MELPVSGWFAPAQRVGGVLCDKCSSCRLLMPYDLKISPFMSEIMASSYRIGSGCAKQHLKGQAGNRLLPTGVDKQGPEA